MTEDKKKVFYCYIELALDIIGGKWKPLIVYHLNNNRVLRFGEFKRLIPTVNERVLSRLLRELEEKRIIHRDDYQENPPKVEYSLTETGQALALIIISLGHWGKAYNNKFDYAEIDFSNMYMDENC